MRLSAQGMQVSLLLRQVTGESGVALFNPLIGLRYTEDSWRSAAVLSASLHALHSVLHCHSACGAWATEHNTASVDVCWHPFCPVAWL